MAAPPPERLTLAEAAALTGLSKVALARRIERGSLAATKERDGLRRVTLRALAEAGLVNPAQPGERPAWSRQGIDAAAVARELVRTVIEQAVSLYELRRELAALAETTREKIVRMDNDRREMHTELDQARRERADLRRQVKAQARR